MKKLMNLFKKNKTITNEHGEIYSARCFITSDRARVEYTMSLRALNRTEAIAKFDASIVKGGVILDVYKR